MDCYSAYLTSLLNEQTVFPSLCCAKNCRNANHRAYCDLYLRLLYKCIHEAINRYIPRRVCKRSDYCVAGWSDLVADKHVAARDAFLNWVAL